jgi:hypothetical protein
MVVSRAKFRFQLARQLQDFEQFSRAKVGDVQEVPDHLFTVDAGREQEGNFALGTGKVINR